jgi:hypothetical protein
MATLPEIMEAMEAVLGTIPGLRTSATSPDQVSPPWAFVGVPPIGNYHTSLGPARPALEPTVTVLVSAAVSRVGQLALAGYADPTGTGSIPAAFAADPTLGGVVGACQVVRFDPLNLEEVGVIGYFGGRFVFRVLT